MSLPRSHSGFTLIELMTVLSVMAILAAIAFPSFGWLMAVSRLKTASSNFHVALLYARSEALKRNTSITVLSNDDDNWEAGWRVFQDTDGDGDVDSGEAVLRNEAAQQRITITPDDASVTSIVYLRSGRTQGGASPAFTVADPAYSSATRCVTIGLSGMPATKDSAC